MRRCCVLLALCLALGGLASGCSVIPTARHKTQHHNPFPQLTRVAVLPFYNQSDYPHLDGEQVAQAYYAALQQTPGFEVVPVGVVKRFLAGSQFEPRSAADFQGLAKSLGVDAVIAGAITDFTPYYPPRMGLAVNWYAANPCFHEIPPGYALPWGTPDEKRIPDRVALEAELALARAQLKTQTPDPEAKVVPAAAAAAPVAVADGEGTLTLAPPPFVLPEDWPDERGFRPAPPNPERPPCVPHVGPIISQTRVYDGRDDEFTAALANYFRLHDDARFGGWQAYLERSDDFVRFCCYQHLVETLASRGGAGQSRVVWRWPISRYQR